MSSLKISTENVLLTKYYSHLRSVYAYCRSLPYLGNNLECPCCGGHFRRFRSFGVHSRPNAQCPRCLSLERHRLQWLYLKNKTHLFTYPSRMLHVAPESVFRKAFVAMPNIDYVGVDLSSPVAMVMMDITSTAMCDNAFDVIICNHVLEHIPNDIKAMGELFRVLKPGGWAILQAPIVREKTFEDTEISTPAERLEAYGHEDHFRAYGRDYTERLASVGFCARVDDYAKELGKDAVERYRLPTNEKIYFCSKPVNTTGTPQLQ